MVDPFDNIVEGFPDEKKIAFGSLIQWINQNIENMYVTSYRFILQNQNDFVLKSNEDRIKEIIHEQQVRG